MEKACETFNVSKIPELMLVIYIYQNAKLRRSPYSVAFFVVLYHPRKNFRFLFKLNEYLTEEEIMKVVNF